MSFKIRLLCFACPVGLFLVLLQLPAVGQHGGHLPPGSKLGKVVFQTSCAPEMQEEFNRGIALLHSFTYEDAAAAFRTVAAKDPRCAMAHWGLAMTGFHQLWEPPPGPQELERGEAETARARELQAGTAREREFIAALSTFYENWRQRDHRTRLMAYVKEMKSLHERHPEDREAGLFYALALVASAQPTDKSYAAQREAAAILEPILAAEPDHPGAAHYLIHAYDYPPLAQRGVMAARAYSKVAPAVPHALHMPSHIFTRLGMWQDSIDSNLASAAAARAHGDHSEELHAIDYLAYAYLQMGRDAEADAVRSQLKAMHSSEATAAFKIGYADVAIPTRYALERKDWALAEELPLTDEARPALAAMTRWRRALGAAHLGHLDEAKQGMARLNELRTQLQKEGDVYWAEQVQIQIEEAGAWIAFAGKKREEALRLAQSAADREDATEKNPVTPGAVRPARELLGDLLMEMRRPAEALREYERALVSAPRRFNAAAGAALAAEQSGDRESARRYYQELLEIAGPQSVERTGARPELLRAKAFLAKSANSLSSQ